MKKLFRIDGKLPPKTVLIIEIMGFLFFLLIWWISTYQFESPTAQFNANNGVAPFVFEWTGPDGFKETVEGDGELSGLDYGEYTVSLKDSLGNAVEAKFTINSTSDTAIELPIRAINGSPEEIKKNNEAFGIRIDISLRNSIVNKGILPPPLEVIKSYKELHFEKSLVKNAIISIKLNMLGYIEAISISLLLGFLIGLVPFFRSLLSRYIDAIRFVPLAAVTGLFISWFGMDMDMKVQFLAFGIFVFLVPVVVQRIDEVASIYKQTAYTLGASSWQSIKSVYWPSVASRIIDDIRVLTAISWTYIIVAELINTTEGGLGTMIFRAKRTGGLNEVFAILLLIIFIGFVQDLIFVWLDKKLFPFKYQKTKKYN